MSRLLRDSAERHFKKTLELMQKGEPEQALKELEIAEKYSKLLLNNPRKRLLKPNFLINLEDKLSLGKLLHNMGYLTQAQKLYELFF